MTPEQVAAATYAAMCALPAYAELAQAIDATAEDDARLALLADADDVTRAQALRYIASSRDPVMRERGRRLTWLRADPQRVGWVKLYYREHVADFISEWGVTFDPRNVERGKPAVLPFVLFSKQRELVGWIIERWQGSEGGLIIKPRDCGISWVMMAVACSLCLLRGENLVIGFGSAKEQKLDQAGNPSTLFGKGRMFMQNLPGEFTGSFDVTKHAPYMRILFPDTGSVITGEAGDAIGRGDRTALYFVDEAAHIERSQLVDASLMSTTNCRIDASSVNGMSGTGQSFYEKSLNPNVRQFRIDWRDDPRKTQEWFDKQCRELSPLVVAQELLCDFAASNQGAIIPAWWIQAAVGLAERLGLEPSGVKFASLDVADGGADKNAMAFRHGFALEHVESWTGKNSDLLATAQRAFRLADARGVDDWSYDAAGVGAGIGGFARAINEARSRKHRVTKFLGAAEVMYPERKVPGGGDRTNGDYYANFKAQQWDALRRRFEASYQIIQLLDAGETVPDKLVEACISIDAKIPELARLLSELGQPTWEEALNGKMKCEKKPDGTASPNLADSVVQAFAMRKLPMKITAAALAKASGPAFVQLLSELGHVR